MNKKFFILGIFLFQFFAFSKSNDINKKVVYAETSGTITINGNSYDLPCYIAVGNYDYKNDNARTNLRKVDAQGGYHNSEFIITDQDSFDYFLYYMKSYTFPNLRSQAIELYGDDALYDNFVMITEEQTIWGNGYTLPYKTLSGIQNMDGILDAFNVTVKNWSDAYLNVDLTPVIEGVDYVYLTNYDDPVDEETIRSCLIATDDVDGDITEKIELKEDNYTGETLVPNESYSITYTVTDTSFNTAEFTIYVKVIDTVAPVISGPSNIVSKLSEPFDIDNLLDEYSVEENTEEDCSSTLEIVTDNYTDNEDIPGRYTIKISATDASGNVGYKSVTIIVEDDVKPNISGGNEYTKYTSATLTIKTITEALSATDNVDGDISSLLTVKSDTYSDNSLIPGTYTVVFTVKDSSNNPSDDFTVTIKVEDKTLPVFFINSRILNISSVEQMTHEDILGFLYNTGAIKGNTTDVSFVYDDYTENASTIGTYRVSVKVSYNDETSEVINLGINVRNGANETVEETSEQENAKVTFFDKILSFFRNIFAAIKNIFTKVTIWFKNLFN